jgi:DNA invertase Pin-like site-specific DNA recombinase
MATLFGMFPLLKRLFADYACKSASLYIRRILRCIIVFIAGDDHEACRHLSEGFNERADDGKPTARTGSSRRALWLGLVGVYEDAGIGVKGRDKRPGFDRLLKDATARKANMIAAWSVDRLGRSLRDLIGFLREPQALGRDLYLHQQALDTSTPSGRAMFQMCGVFAEFERGMIRERLNAGLARAKAHGTKPAGETGDRGAHS